jgi:uncharacterized Fe-S center protein
MHLINNIQFGNNIRLGEDKFKGVWGETQALLQVKCGEGIVLDIRSYELIECG